MQDIVLVEETILIDSTPPQISTLVNDSDYPQNPTVNTLKLMLSDVYPYDKNMHV